MLRAVRSALTKRAHDSKRFQADIDFSIACPLLQIHEEYIAGNRGPEDILARYADLRDVWRASSLDKKIVFANDSATVQLSELFQHLHDIDSGDVPQPAPMPLLSPAERASSAAFQPSVGPSTHTNPAPSLAFQMKALYEDESAAADVRIKHLLTSRTGFSLWIGPTQAPTPSNVAGLYLKGRVPPGTVVGLFPGAVYNSEMMKRPDEVGHLGNPRIDRVLIPRLDDAVLDVYGGGSSKTNPFALAHHARHPPPGIVPNVIRMQYDFAQDVERVQTIMPFPQHLRDYIPNVWGARSSTSRTTAPSASMYGMLEASIFCKGMILVATRPLLDEEIFVDHALNPFAALPAWYRPIDADAPKRLWRGVLAE